MISLTGLCFTLSGHIKPRIPIHSTIEKIFILCENIFIISEKSRREILIPAQRPAGLIFGHARFEEVLLLLQIDHFAHPGKRVRRVGVQFVQADLLAAAVGDEAQVFLEHAGVQAQYAARHGVFGVAVFQLYAFLHQSLDFFAEFRSP